MEEVADVEMPSPKRMRVEAIEQLNTKGRLEPKDEFNDIYGTPSKDEEKKSSDPPLHTVSKADTKSSADHIPPSLPSLPGLATIHNEGAPSHGFTEFQTQQSLQSALFESVPAVEMADEETSQAKPPEELQNREHTLSTVMDGHGRVADKSISESIDSSTVEKTTDESLQNESAKHVQPPPDILPMDPMSPLPKKETSVEDPLTTLEASLPPEASRKPMRLEAQDAEKGVETKPMIEAPTFEHLVTANKPNTDAEFELDSSPLNSDSESSDDTSSSDDSDADDYEMLDPEEQARRLMAEDGGSDDEGGGGAAAKEKISGPLRTQNEKPDEHVPKPDVAVTAEMKIEELGNVEGTVENVVLVKAKISGEYQVLEHGSVLCLEDRSVIGVVAETLGRVQQPYYSVRFTNTTAIVEAGITKNTKIFYVEQYSTSVFTQPLRAFKGSDASNLHDEEVGDEELEFSDDEAEAEHKRRIKIQRQQKRMGREGQNDGFSKVSRGGRGASSRGGGRRNGIFNVGTGETHGIMGQKPNSTEAALNYDDVANDMSIDGDDLYTPLARPTNLHEIMGPQAPPTENLVPQRGSDKGSHSRGRSRGDRGGGRGFGRGRGQGRGAFGQRGGHGNHQHPGSFPSQPLQNGNGFAALASAQPYPSTAYSAASPVQQQSYASFQPQYHAQWNQQHAFQHPQQPYNNDAYQTHGLSQTYTQPLLTPKPAASASNSIPPGAHINPAFFRQQQQ